MSLTILNVAYPLAPAGLDAVGGAEQVLSELDRALVEAGHRSIVVACEGSRMRGMLVSVPRAEGALDEQAIAAARARHRHAVASVLQQWSVDVVHLHGVDFEAYLPPPGVPTLVTLHGPANWYSRTALYPHRPDTWLHCVSLQQHASVAPNPHFLPPIENGVAIEAFSGDRARRRWALVLSRIAPEKGIHIAIEAAKRADVPLLIAGQLFDYPEHRRYFHEDVVPRLDRGRRFIGPIGLLRKRRLLAAARCLLIASRVAETSSLAAREALAAGTPVIAMAEGALVDTVEHGRTGFLVHDRDEMASAIARTDGIDRETCRSAARERFSSQAMIARYFETYRALADARYCSLRRGAA